MNKVLNLLRINVLDHHTEIEYIEGGDKLFSYKYDIGHQHIDEQLWSLNSGKNWFAYILWVLHNISYTSRIPTNFILHSGNNVFFFKNIIDIHSYNEFFLDNSKIYVTIHTQDNVNYERYKKTISQFKI